MRPRPVIFVLAIATALAAFASAAAAQSGAAAPPSIFTRPGGDWAISWLDYIFRGIALPGGLAEDPKRLGNITVALRAALSIYSLGMLAIAGLLVLYHVMAMVAETAHYGNAMGCRTNQLWTPIRFVVALGLLVPVSGGLSSGQYIIVKLAEQGSGLASNAWRATVDTMKESFSGFTAPRSPDLARATSVAVEMELCRAIYHQVYASLLPDVFIALAGDMPPAARKIPPQRLAPETWRYSNTLHNDLPLCGEYRFMAQNWAIASPDSTPNRTETFANDLADFSHDSADRLILKTQSLTSAVSSSFLPGVGPNGVVTPPAMPVSGLNIDGMLNGFRDEQSKALDAKLRAIATSSGDTMGNLLDASANGGWLQASIFVADLTQMQAVNGNLSANAVPAVQAPIFGHTRLMRDLLRQAIADNPTLRTLTLPQLEKLTLLYERTNAAMGLARQWLYGQQIANAALILADPFDMQDQLSPASDMPSGFFMFNRLLDAASVTYGVWADAPGAATENNLAFLRDRAGNPLLALAEFGRRYANLGNYLVGMSGMAYTQPGVSTVAILYTIIGGLFCLAGLALTYLLPLIPFIRFFFAILVWLLAVFEAVAALPLVALAHINPVGDGLSGSTARHAYWLWLSIFMRPLLTLFGFVIGLILLAFSMSFLNIIFIHLIGNVAVAHNGVFSGIRVALALLYVALAYIAANQSFKGINLLPDKAISWLGQAITAEPATANTSPSAVPRQLGGSDGTTARFISGYVTGSGGQGAAAAVYGAESATQREGRTARDRNMGSSLFPAYMEKPLDAVNIPAGGATASGSASVQGGSSGAASSSSATASAGGVTATAIASAIAKQVPAKDNPTHPEILKAASALSLLAESHKVTEKSGNKTPPPVDGKPAESQEQSAATPKSDEPS